MSTAVGRALTSALDGQIGPYGLTICFQVMPALDPEAYAELKADIKANGIHNPVIYDQNDQVIDGHHRLQIADELDLDSDEIPWTQVHVSDPAAGRDMAYRVNTHRRHLTRDQKREALERSLRADPDLSNRQHAERVGVSHHTVGSVRDDLESTGQIAQSEVRQGRDGRERPATQPTRAVPVAEIPEEMPDQTRPVENLRDIGEHTDPERSAPSEPAPAPRPVRGPTARTEEQRQWEVIETARRIASHVVASWQTDVVSIIAGIELGERDLVTQDMVNDMRAALDLLEARL